MSSTDITSDELEALLTSYITPSFIKPGEEIIKPPIYMDPSYEKGLSGHIPASYCAAIAQTRQASIFIDGKWFLCRDYQNAAVLHTLKLYKGSILSMSFAVPDKLGGGLFKIIFINTPNSDEHASYKIYLLRQDGTFNECKIHHGDDSEKILGVHQDRFESK